MPAKLTQEQFIEKAKAIHGDRYDYSKVEYINGKIKIKISCSKHGIFIQQPEHHLYGSGCQKCAIERKPQCCHLSTNQFIINANKINGNKYDYSNARYTGNKNKVKIICKIHGEFQQTPNNHLRGTQCPKCYKNYKGEIKIETYFKEHKIKYITQKRFKDCRGTMHPMSFDFYLPNHNTCIEYDGEQHFRPIQWYGISQKRANKNFKQIQLHDKIKNEYCSKNNIRLIRIPYTKINDIEKIISRFI